MTDVDDWVQEINAVTLVCADMGRSCDFYTSIGFSVLHGGPGSQFTTLSAGSSYLNLQLDPAWSAPDRVWGRVIIWVDDVDDVYRRFVAAGHRCQTTPADAPWGERFFHVRDADGHELSFARPLGRRS